VHDQTPAVGEVWWTVCRTNAMMTPPSAITNPRSCPGSFYSWSADLRAR
jgi:hypothetical protein